MAEQLDWRAAKLLRTRDLSPDIRLFEIEPTGDFVTPKAGSHINVTVQIGEKDGAPMGYAFIDTQLVRTLPETLLVLVSPEGTVAKLLLLAFYEPPEYEAPARWLAQFDGKPLGPDLRVEREIHGIAGATWGPADGVVDPHLATSAFLDLARRHGATVRFRSPVTSIEPGDEWTVRAGQHTIRAQYVVNAAGGWSGEVAALSGLAVPVVHSRRNIYATAAGAIDRPVPMTIDLGTGVYVRSEGTRLLFGGARPDQPDGYDTSVDWDWMESALGAAVNRFPWVADLPLDRRACWAGTYENSPDHHGIKRLPRRPSSPCGSLSIAAAPFAVRTGNSAPACVRNAGPSATSRQCASQEANGSGGVASTVKPASRGPRHDARSTVAAARPR